MTDDTAARLAALQARRGTPRTPRTTPTAPAAHDPAAWPLHPPAGRPLAGMVPPPPPGGGTTALPPPPGGRAASAASRRVPSPARRRRPAAASKILAVGLSSATSLGMVAVMARSAAADAGASDVSPAAPATDPAGTVRLVLPDGRTIVARQTRDGLVAVLPADVSSAAASTGTLPPIAVPTPPPVVATPRPAHTSSHSS